MTLREEIKAIQKVYEPQDEEDYLDKVMQIIHADNKARYGWTEENCPYKYGEEIEVKEFLEDDWERGLFKTYHSKHSWKPYETLSGNLYNFARAIPKEEHKLTTWQIELDKLLKNETTIEANGKKYKLVEVVE